MCVTVQCREGTEFQSMDRCGAGRGQINHRREAGEKKNA